MSMDLFPDLDDVLVKYCLTPENEQKLLHADLLSLRQELADGLRETKVRSAFILKNCTIIYDVQTFVLTSNQESNIKIWLTGIHTDLKNIDVASFYAHKNSWAGRGYHTTSLMALTDNVQVENIYDTIYYHEYAIKILIKLVILPDIIRTLIRICIH